MTSNKSHVAFQELTIYEDAGTKLHNINLSTPEEIMEDNVNKSNTKIMKEINCEHADCKGNRVKHEILAALFPLKNGHYKNSEIQRSLSCWCFIFFIKTC